MTLLSVVDNLDFLIFLIILFKIVIAKNYMLHTHWYIVYIWKVRRSICVSHFPIKNIVLFLYFSQPPLNGRTFAYWFRSREGNVFQWKWPVSCKHTFGPMEPSVITRIYINVQFIAIQRSLSVVLVTWLPGWSNKKESNKRRFKSSPEKKKKGKKETWIIRLVTVALNCWFTGFEFVNLDMLYESDLVHADESYARWESL